MERKDSSNSEQEIRELNGFEEAFIEYLFEHGHLAAAVRPEWEKRLRSRRKLSRGAALDAHRTAVLDCLAMSDLWSRTERDAADRFLAGRGVPTISALSSRRNGSRSKFPK